MKRRFKVLTFTIISNNVNARVTRFRLPKIFIYLGLLILLSPFVYLLHSNQQYFSVIEEQKKEMEILSAKLLEESDKKNALQRKVVLYEQNSDATTQYLKELFELESEMRNYLEELPSIVQPSGGIEIPINDLL